MSNDEQVKKAARAEAERRYITGGGRYVAGEGIDAFVAGVTWFRARQGDFEHAAGVGDLTAEVERLRFRMPCDGGCNYNSGPEETCSLHGRPPREVWEIADGQIGRANAAEAERDEARQQVADLRAEAERHALANDGCVPGAAYRDLAAAHADLRDALARAAADLSRAGWDVSYYRAALAGDTTEAGAEGWWKQSVRDLVDDGTLEAARPARDAREDRVRSVLRDVRRRWMGINEATDAVLDALHPEPAPVSAADLARALEEHAPIGKAWYRHKQTPTPLGWVLEFLDALGIAITDATAGGEPR